MPTPGTPSRRTVAATRRARASVVAPFVAGAHKLAPERMIALHTGAPIASSVAMRGAFADERRIVVGAEVGRVY